MNICPRCKQETSIQTARVHWLVGDVVERTKEQISNTGPKPGDLAILKGKNEGGWWCLNKGYQHKNAEWSISQSFWKNLTILAEQGIKS